MTGVWTTDENYNQDDLGISRWYNNQNIFANISYEIFNPSNYFNQLEIKLGVRHGRRFKPSVKRNNNYDLDLFFETKKLYKHRIEIEYRTLNKDFFEPRVDGLFVLKPKEISFQYDFDTDNTKDLVYGVIIGGRKGVAEFYGENNNKVGSAFGVDYKVSDRLKLNSGIGISFEKDNLGYAGSEEENVILGIRDIKVNQAMFELNYNFDSYKGISLEIRNYWSSVNYKSYYALQSNGIGVFIEDYPLEDNPNTNFQNEIGAYSRAGGGVNIGLIGADGKIDQSIIDPLDRFKIFVDATARKLIDTQYITEIDINVLLENANNLKYVNYKNSTAYVLGYIVSKGGREIEITHFNDIIKKILPILSQML